MQGKIEDFCCRVYIYCSEIGRDNEYWRRGNKGEEEIRAARVMEGWDKGRGTVEVGAVDDDGF